jgi:hypothetical protein
VQFAVAWGYVLQSAVAGLIGSLNRLGGWLFGLAKR